MKSRYLFPLLITILILALLWRGLSLHPAQIPSPLVNKPSPTFSLPTLANPKKMTTNQDFLGHVTLVNVWATWCYACSLEHEYLLQLAKNENIYIYGIDYKDDPEAAKKWLEQNNNPYKIVAVDEVGKTGIDWGVYGTPETFVLDKKGVIRYKLIGPMNAQVWQEKIKPLVTTLQSEP